MTNASRLLWAQLTTVIALSLLLGGANLHAQTPSEVTVTVVVTLDDLPCPGSKVTIRPLGSVAGWPEGKSRITLTTDTKGHASAHLGPGKYLAVAHDPGNSRLPADGSFSIKPGQSMPMKIHLNLLYWDCGKVTCML